MLKDRQSASLMVADKRQKPQRFGKFAVGGGLKLTEHILTDVNKKERFAYFVARDKVCATAARANRLKIKNKSADYMTPK